jgi:hypothetical protein
MLKTPLLIDLNYLLDQTKKKTLPTETEQLTLTKSFNGNKFYYLKIYPPKYHPVSQEVQTFHLNPNTGLMRFSLPPSIGYGINSCYRVEYYSWFKTYKEHLNRSSTDNSINTITSSHYATEYWYVRPINNTFIKNIDEYNSYSTKHSRLSRIKLVKQFTIAEDLSYLADIYVHSVNYQNQNIFFSLFDKTNPEFIDEYNPVDFNILLKIDCVPLGEEYTINYYPRILLQELIFNDDLAIFQNLYMFYNYKYSYLNNSLCQDKSIEPQNPFQLKTVKSFKPTDMISNTELISSSMYLKSRFVISVEVLDSSQRVANSEIKIQIDIENEGLYNNADPKNEIKILNEPRVYSFSASDISVDSLRVLLIESTGSLYINKIVINSN